MRFVTITRGTLVVAGGVMAFMVAACWWWPAASNVEAPSCVRAV
jgi:hypothetical protein